MLCGGGMKGKGGWGGTLLWEWAGGNFRRFIQGQGGISIS